MPNHPADAEKWPSSIWFILTACFSQCGQPHLSSTGLVLDVVDGADLGAHVLQVGSGGVDGARVSRSAGHRGFLLQRGLLGNWGFGDDAAAMRGLTVGRSSWSGGCGAGDGSTGCEGGGGMRTVTII